jgi:hypothetical protein
MDYVDAMSSCQYFFGNIFMLTTQPSKSPRKPKPKSTGIGWRLREVIEGEINKNRLITLEKMSGIGKTSWGNMLSGIQKASHEMIEFVCGKWPQYAYYVAVGEIPLDSIRHSMPSLDALKENKIEISILLSKEAREWSTNEAFCLMSKWNAGELKEVEAGLLAEKFNAKTKGRLFKAHIEEKIAEAENTWHDQYSMAEEHFSKSEIKGQKEYVKSLEEDLNRLVKIKELQESLLHSLNKK